MHSSIDLGCLLLLFRSKCWITQLFQTAYLSLYKAAYIVHSFSEKEHTKWRCYLFPFINTLNYIWIGAAAIIFPTASHLRNSVLLPVFIFTTAEFDQCQAPTLIPHLFSPPFYCPLCFACPPNSTSGFSPTVTAAGKRYFNFNEKWRWVKWWPQNWNFLEEVYFSWRCVCRFSYKLFGFVTNSRWRSNLNINSDNLACKTRPSRIIMWQNLFDCVCVEAAFFWLALQRKKNKRLENKFCKSLLMQNIRRNYLGTHKSK